MSTDFPPMETERSSFFRFVGLITVILVAVVLLQVVLVMTYLAVAYR